MNTVVVPLDGSPVAEQALPYAVALARRSGSPMLLVSIIEVPVELGAWGAASAMALGGELDAWSESQKGYLHTLAEKTPDLNVSTIVQIGSPGYELLNVIEQTDNPVVVMSSHGRTGVRRIVLGSVANRIVRDAHCPVMVIRARDQESQNAAPSFDRALVPLDGSQFSERALHEALGVIDGGSLKIHVVRVVEIPSLWMPGPDIPIDYGLVQEYTDAMADESKAYLTRLSEDLTKQGRQVTWEVREGQAANEIIKAAIDFEADVIAMSTHGRGGFGRVIFGSVAERILHEATIPLLLIRPRD